MRILITGMAGSGKTSVIAELRKSGHIALDLDDCGVCTFVHKQTEEPATYTEGAGKDWIEAHRWQVTTPKLIDLLASFPEDETVYCGGKISKRQVSEMSKIFDVMYLLQPNDSVADERLNSRTTNKHNFGKKKEEREFLIQTRHEFERACIENGAIPLENHGTVQEVVAEILKNVQ